MIKPVEPLFKDALTEISVISQSREINLISTAYDKAGKGVKFLPKMQSVGQEDGIKDKMWKTQVNFN